MQLISTLLAQDPLARSAQISIVVAGFLALFLIFFATRDIILRTHSFVYQCSAIILVALLPGVGFLLYLLIRPARTLKERELERKVMELLAAQKGVGEVTASV